MVTTANVWSTDKIKVQHSLTFFCGMKVSIISCCDCFLCGRCMWSGRWTRTRLTSGWMRKTTRWTRAARASCNANAFTHATKRYAHTHSFIHMRQRGTITYLHIYWFIRMRRRGTIQWPIHTQSFIHTRQRRSHTHSFILYQCIYTCNKEVQYNHTFTHSFIHTHAMKRYHHTFTHSRIHPTPSAPSFTDVTKRCSTNTLLQSLIHPAIVHIHMRWIGAVHRLTHSHTHSFILHEAEVQSHFHTLTHSPSS